MSSSNYSRKVRLCRPTLYLIKYPLKSIIGLILRAYLLYKIGRRKDYVGLHIVGVWPRKMANAKLSLYGLKTKQMEEVFFKK